MFCAFAKCHENRERWRRAAEPLDEAQVLAMPVDNIISFLSFGSGRPDRPKGPNLARRRARLWR